MGMPAESEKVLNRKETENVQIDNSNIESEKAQLDEAIAQIIEQDLPTEQKTQQISQIIQISRESFSGPLPHPDILRGYHELIPSAPERILAMAEKEQQHRIEADNEMLAQNRENITNSKRANDRSQNRAAILITLLIVAGSVLTLYGHQTVGTTIFRYTIIGVASVFIIGKLIPRNRKNKTEV